MDELQMFKQVASLEELDDARSMVEDALAKGTDEIEVMLRRKSSRLVLTEEQRKRIQFALDVLNKIAIT